MRRLNQALVVKLGVNTCSWYYDYYYTESVKTHIVVFVIACRCLEIKRFDNTQGNQNKSNKVANTAFLFS